MGSYETMGDFSLDESYVAMMLPLGRNKKKRNLGKRMACLYARDKYQGRCHPVIEEICNKQRVKEIPFTKKLWYTNPSSSCSRRISRSVSTPQLCLFMSHFYQNSLISAAHLAPLFNTYLSLPSWNLHS